MQAEIKHDPEWQALRDDSRVDRLALPTLSPSLEIYLDTHLPTTNVVMDETITHNTTNSTQACKNDNEEEIMFGAPVLL